MLDRQGNSVLVVVQLLSFFRENKGEPTKRTSFLKPKIIIDPCGATKGMKTTPCVSALWS